MKKKIKYVDLRNLNLLYSFEIINRCICLIFLLIYMYLLDIVWIVCKFIFLSVYYLF